MLPAFCRCALPFGRGALARTLLAGLVGLACLCGWGAPAPARAYVLPADFLCRLLADSRRASLKDVTLTLTATLADREGEVEERLYVKRPERMRLVQLQDANAPAAAATNQVQLLREGLAAAGPEGQLLDQGMAANPWPALWLPKGKDLDEMSARMLEALEGVGIDSNVVSLSRYPGGVAYVVGAKPWQADRPQLWLDKATFQPVRILWPIAAGAPASGKAIRPGGSAPRPPEAAPATNAPAPSPPGNTLAVGSGMHELRLLEYVAGIPRRLEEWEDGRLLRRSEVRQVVVNQNLPESLFALPSADRR